MTENQITPPVRAGQPHDTMPARDVSIPPLAELYVLHVGVRSVNECGAKRRPDRIPVALLLPSEADAQVIVRVARRQGLPTTVRRHPIPYRSRAGLDYPTIYVLCPVCNRTLLHGIAAVDSPSRCGEAEDGEADGE